MTHADHFTWQEPCAYCGRWHRWWGPHDEQVLCLKQTAQCEVCAALLTDPTQAVVAWPSSFWDRIWGTVKLRHPRAKVFCAACWPNVDWQGAAEFDGAGQGREPDWDARWLSEWLTWTDKQWVQETGTRRAGVRKPKGWARQQAHTLTAAAEQIQCQKR